MAQGREVGHPRRLPFALAARGIDSVGARGLTCRILKQLQNFGITRLLSQSLECSPLCVSRPPQSREPLEESRRPFHVIGFDCVPNISEFNSQKPGPLPQILDCPPRRSRSELP